MPQRFAQLYQAYAPGRETPPTLRAAMERAHALQATATSDTGVVPTQELMLPGDKPATDRVLGADGTETVNSALASSIDQSWFTSALCGFSSVNSSWCFTTASLNR